jgi:two-component system NtrC family sensor kinase
MAAESHATAMDLFLQEMVVNLSNMIEDPKLTIPPPPAVMRELLAKLRRASDVFEDLGFVDSEGKQTAYEGPYAELRDRDYSGERWFAALQNGGNNFIVTDRNEGLRGKSHFTLAVRRNLNGRYVMLRTALDPQRLYLYFSSVAESSDVDLAIINSAGHYQLSASPTEHEARLSEIIPPSTPRFASATARFEGNNLPYAYAWLRTCDWIVTATPSAASAANLSRNLQINIIAFSAAIIALIFSVIVVRAKKIVQTIRQADTTRAQLSDDLLHASKLAAVGELAAGIAHEINNPLAIINEEVGLIKDMADPKFKVGLSLQDCMPHLDSIQEAVLRCRDITGKMLAFVRKGEISVRPHNLHEVIDEIVDSFYGRGMASFNVDIVRSYCRDDPFVLADRTQLGQVFLNIINNAMDALEGKGTITITTTLLRKDERVKIDVEDTGMGMTQEQLERIFLPFYTTKQVGKGTGLGLSITYAIVKSMAGEISVDSTEGAGSTFTIILPIQPRKEAAEEAAWKNVALPD